jgi:oxygen-independent coproporphyrinogen-3 oxidase
MARPFSVTGPLTALAAFERPRTASLYIHVPFCAGACDYCDFYSVAIKGEDSRIWRFIDVLLEEGTRLLETFMPESIPTLYIGGGTPSVLGAAGIDRLLAGLSGRIAAFAPPPQETTVEANPESCDEAFLAAAREGGVTRLSLGVQTFHGPSRLAVNRIGGITPTGHLSIAASYFPDALSVDLISGLPFQDERVLLDDISAVLACAPAHVSLYALTLDPETTPAAPLPRGDEADSLWLCGRDALEKAGYGQYEVSNFCLRGRESRHNIRYWRMEGWLALGPAASATIVNDETGSGFRYTIPPDVDRWLEAGGCGFSEDSGYRPLVEELDSVSRIKETILMGFRYIEGPDEDLFCRRFARGIEDCIPKTIAAWRSRGLFRKDKCALTKSGMLLLNRFLVEAFGELDASI